jgi:hypothetical protein
MDIPILFVYFQQRIPLLIKYDLSWTVEYLLEHIGNIYKIPSTRITLIYKGLCYNYDRLLSYCFKDSSGIIYIVLRSQTPRDKVYNYRIVHKIIGDYIPENECMICLDKSPNIANNRCTNHDSMLCLKCANDLKKLNKNCPHCNNLLDAFELCN